MVESSKVARFEARVAATHGTEKITEVTRIEMPPIPARGPVCLTAHEPSSTMPLEETGRFKIPIRLIDFQMIGVKHESRKLEGL